MPKLYAREQRPNHPYLVDYGRNFNYDDYFESPRDVKKALSGYFGLVSYLDENIGKLLFALQDAGLVDDTVVMYTSDHGDNLGARGLWGKSTMYEESAGIPLIVAGPDVPRGAVCDVPVSLVDAFPTIVQSTGAQADPADADLPGRSLIAIANGETPTRTVLSEYHAAGAVCGSYMIRHGRYKYVHYAGLPPMLFDLEADPGERIDLGPDPQYSSVIRSCEAALRAVVDPEAADRQAKMDQQAKIAAAGGKDAILKRGTFRYSPPPGARPAYH